MMMPRLYSNNIMIYLLISTVMVNDYSYTKVVIEKFVILSFVIDLGSMIGPSLGHGTNI